MTESIPVPDFAPWHVENLRLTIFHSTSSPIPGLWERLMGISPEAVDSKPRERVLREQGGANGNQLLLVAQPQRLDWNFIPHSPADPKTRSLPILTAVDQAIPVLRKALDISLQSLRPVHRLAFGSVLTQQASSLSEGTNQLSRCLPHMGLESPVEDFIYQINRRRRSSYAPHVQINRLAKWQLEQFQSGAIRITSSQNLQWEPSDSGVVSKLVLDINTATENNAISADKMPTLFVELVELAREIAAEGDIP